MLATPPSLGSIAAAVTAAVLESSQSLQRWEDPSSQRLQRLEMPVGPNDPG